MICMRKFGHYFSLLTGFFFKYMPWQLNEVLAIFLSYLWVDVLKLRRQVVFDNFEIAFPQKLSIQQKQELMRKNLFYLCRSFFDIMKIPSLNNKWIDENVIYHGLENVTQDKGQLFLTLHLGSGDLVAAIISDKIVPLSLISKRFKNAFVDQFWFSLRGQSKTQFIDAHGKNNAFEILKALKNKRAVVFVLDQFMGKPYGIETEFFGQTTGTAYGLSLFAQKTKAPVVPLYTYWDEQKKLHICFEKPIETTLSSLDLGQDDINREMTNQYNRVLEDIIRKHPNQWMWVHRRWKKFE